MLHALVTYVQNTSSAVNIKVATSMACAKSMHAIGHGSHTSC